MWARCYELIVIQERKARCFVKVVSLKLYIVLYDFFEFALFIVKSSSTSHYPAFLELCHDEDFAYSNDLQQSPGIFSHAFFKIELQSHCGELV
jgi:hypothetical protein